MSSIKKKLHKKLSGVSLSLSPSVANSNEGTPRSNSVSFLKLCKYPHLNRLRLPEEKFIHFGSEIYKEEYKDEITEKLNDYLDPNNLESTYQYYYGSQTSLHNFGYTPGDTRVSSRVVSRLNSLSSLKEGKVLPLQATNSLSGNRTSSLHHRDSASPSGSFTNGGIGRNRYASGSSFFSKFMTKSTPVGEISENFEYEYSFNNVKIINKELSYYIIF